MTYKELMRELPDEITPEDAQKEYQAYLTEWWGSEVRFTGRECFTISEYCRSSELLELSVKQSIDMEHVTNCSCG